MHDASPRRRGVLASIGAGLTALRTFTANVLFVLVLVVVLVALLSSSEETVVVPDGAALVLRLDGPVVESRPDFDPLDALLRDDDAPRPIALRDLVEALERAAEDDRIEALVLELSAFPGAAPATLRAVGDALADFRASGKPIFTGADFLSQSQYLLASQSTYLYLNPMGQVFLRGFASEPTFFASALEKLRVNVHVFRVGEYKSAVEPFVRDDMSDAAREAYQALVDGLWSEYRTRIAENRRLPEDALDGLVRELPGRLRAVDGDLARLALETGLVDELLTRDAFEARIADVVGRDEDTEEPYRRVGLRAYLNNTRLADLGPVGSGARRVGVVVAEGTITGSAEAGEVGEPTAALIRRARQDPDVAAIVLRVNSPGGSAFFSEVVRKELELAQLQGKPVVASMGGVAASGGYWISATADRIFAEADTITGSIGIFGLLPTFEESAAAVGVHSDGVGTHALAGAGNPLRALNPAFADLLQQSVERGYERFLDTVARGRGMTPEDVDAVGQGRVWLGRSALELGLVDELGGMDAAVRSAATMAGLTEWDVDWLEPPKSARDQFLERLFASPAAGAVSGLVDGATLRSLERFSAWAASPLALLASLDDPQHLYALCAVCPR